MIRKESAAVKEKLACWLKDAIVVPCLPHTGNERKGKRGSGGRGVGEWGGGGPALLK